MDIGTTCPTTIVWYDFDITNLITIQTQAIQNTFLGIGP